MTGDRAHPFTLVFGELAPTRLPAIEAELRGETSLEAFLFGRAAVELLGELRPDDGIGEAIDDFVVFVHAAFLYWAAGEHTAAFDEAGTRDLCRATSAAVSQPRTDRGSNDATRIADPAHAMGGPCRGVRSVRGLRRQGHGGIRGELPEQLSASTARRRELLGIRNDSHGGEADVPLGNGLHQGHPLGTNGQAVAGTLDVAPGDDGAVVREQRRTDAEARVRCKRSRAGFVGGED